MSFQNYSTKERFGRGALSSRLALACVFLLAFGFAGGVPFLLFVMVPVEEWMVDRGMGQGTMDALLAAMVFGWVLVGLLATALYARLFLRRSRGLLPAVGAAGVVLVAAGAVFSVMLDNDVLAAAGQLGQQSSQEGQRIVFGPYPDAERLEELEGEGYDGVITLLSPKVPFERVLLRQEKQNGEEVGIPVYSRPMLPWISGNETSLEAIKALVARRDRQFYVHCYLGKHRVDLVRQELEAGAPEAADLPYRFERGRVVEFAGGDVILGPYPTEEEFFEYVLRRDVEEIVSTLDPKNPDDAPWIREEKRIAEENGIKFTLVPLDPSSPDRRVVGEIARYVENSGRKTYLHDFLEADRFEALKVELRGGAR